MGALGNRSVLVKLLLLAGVAVGPLTAGVLGYALPTFEAALRADHEAKVREVVEVAFSSLERYHALAVSGALSPDEARARAAAHLAALRYGQDDYFWINDLSPRMVMHPFKPELDGADLSGFEDERGLRLFQEMVAVCRDQGEGFVTYYWPRPGEDAPVPKLSFVKLFEPWGWIVGSGVYVDDLEAEVGALRWRLGVLVALALLAAAGGTLWIARAVTVPLGRTVRAMEALARGDLTARVELDQADELGTLARAADAMAERLRTLIGQIADAGMELGATAEQLSVSTVQVSSANRELTARSQGMAASSEELATTVGQVAANTEGVARTAEHARQRASEGRTVIAETVESIEEVAAFVQQATATVTNLGTQSEAIGAVVELIEDVADQTNLLALNAAIEAARAGEHGRGFAVVADEVRRLAEKTVTATREIAESISTVQSEGRAAVAAMEQGQTVTAAARERGGRVAEAIDGIEEAVAAASEETEQIATATEELSATVEELARNMDEVARGIEQSSQATLELSASAEVVTRKSDDLNRLTGTFRR